MSDRQEPSGHLFRDPGRDDVTRDGRKGRLGFVVRRFAGHRRHSEQLGRPIRIAHLTDMHCGLITRRHVQEEAVRLANQEKPDLVALTGDFVGFGQRYLDVLEHVVSQFEAPVIAVLGNHDHWAGAREVRLALERGGALVLQNEWTELSLGHETLQVVGVDDAYTGHADAARAVKGLVPGKATLGLSHVGEEAEPLWAAGVPLVLSGHTHAGHVTLAGFHHAVLRGLGGHRFVHGLYGSRTDPPPRGALYVSAGVGSARIPVRIGERAWREVAAFDLGVAPGSLMEHHGEQEGGKGRPTPQWLRERRQALIERERRRRERWSSSQKT